MTSDSNNPRLELIWHKSFNEVYCHQANFRILKSVINHTDEDIVKIIIKRIENNINKGEAISSIIKNIERFLPLKEEDDVINVPLNSPEILEALCEISWTSKKNGERGSLRIFPLSLSIEFPLKKQTRLWFDVNSEIFPLTLFEKYFADMKEGEKLETAIYFS